MYLKIELRLPFAFACNKCTFFTSFWKELPMKKFLMLTAICLAMASGFTVHAAGKMGQCHKDAKAKSLTGDERKAFMKECLSAKGSASESTKAETET